VSSVYSRGLKVWEIVLNDNDSDTDSVINDKTRPHIPSYDPCFPLTVLYRVNLPREHQCHAHHAHHSRLEATWTRNAVLAKARTGSYCAYLRVQGSVRGVRTARKSLNSSRSDLRLKNQIERPHVMRIRLCICVDILRLERGVAAVVGKAT
jgi:hypothetical protein